MKYKWLSILFLWGAWAACEDDAAVFEASVPAEGITFAPVNGDALCLAEKHGYLRRARALRE